LNQLHVSNDQVDYDSCPTTGFTVYSLQSDVTTLQHGVWAM